MELKNKISQIETLSIQLSNLQSLQSKELVCESCFYKFILNCNIFY